MTKGRLEAFSDGVVAIIITLMVLELKVPAGHDLAALGPVVPSLLIYLLSYVHLGIYWNNHHHLLHAAQHVSGPILWANLHLLFWLSLVPFVTAWVGESHFAPWPVAAYGGVLWLAGLAYYLLTRALIARHGPTSAIASALGRDVKGKLSVVLYAVAIAVAFLNVWVSIAIYAANAIVWIIPDRRIERALAR
jgi:uncharacterized membrane protein